MASTPAARSTVSETSDCGSSDTTILGKMERCHRQYHVLQERTTLDDSEVLRDYLNYRGEERGQWKAGDDASGSHKNAATTAALTACTTVTNGNGDLNKCQGDERRPK